MKLLKKIDTSIDFIYEEQYKSKEKLFLSTWDIELNEIEKTPFLISKIEKGACINNDYYKYFFWNDQGLKEHFQKYIKKIHNISIEPKKFTISTNGSSAIYMSLSILRRKFQNVCIISPNYFTSINILNELKFNIYYESIIERGEFHFNSKKFKKELFDNKIELVLITNPIFSTGINFLSFLDKDLLDFINENNIFILIDNMYGGMEWQERNAIFDYHTYQIIQKIKNYIFLESPIKKFFLNGAKFCIIISSNKEISNNIEKESVIYIGSMAASQINAYKEFYNIKNAKKLNEILCKNIKVAEKNYQMLKLFLKNTNFNLMECKSGFFCLAYIKKKYTDDILNSLDISSHYDILTIPHSRYLLDDENFYYFRINLLANIENIVTSLSKKILK